MTPIIPLELWDWIIDHLHDDERALSTCGLVCRSWISSSRFHLFRTIQLSKFDIKTSLALCAPGSTIPPYVRALEMFENDAPTKWHSPWVSNALQKMPRLGALERLSLHFVAWGSLTPEAKERLFALSHGLKTLSLINVEFETISQALHFISSAPLLECLSLENSTFRSWEAPLTIFHVPPIKHVTFYLNRHPSFILDCLCISQPVPSVRSLSFEVIYVAQIPSISACLRRLGPFLEHLHFEKSSRWLQGIQVDFIPMTKNIND
jgi:hypothetical protein